MFLYMNTFGLLGSMHLILLLPGVRLVPMKHLKSHNQRNLMKNIVYKRHKSHQVVETGTYVFQMCKTSICIITTSQKYLLSLHSLRENSCKPFYRGKKSSITGRKAIMYTDKTVYMFFLETYTLLYLLMRLKQKVALQCNTMELQRLG